MAISTTSFFLASAMKQEKETKDLQTRADKNFPVYAKISRETTIKVTGSKSFKKK